LSNTTNEQRNPWASTFETHTISFNFNSKSYRFFDVTGYGASSDENHLLNLVHLTKQTSQGLHLLVMVIQGEPKADDIFNYQFFVQQMANKQIPVICLAIGYNEETKFALEKALQSKEMKFNEVVNGFERHTNESIIALWAVINKWTSPIAIDFPLGQ